MEHTITIKPEIYDEIMQLMQNIDDVNKGNEIGAWMTGTWKQEDDKYHLYLDKFIIPKQEVSGTEVDIGPESMTDTLKEIGPEECKRIKAHWHIHPFGKGETDWSSIDDDKIEDFMKPDKDRGIFCFLLSSEDRIKGRIEINMKGKIKGFNKEYTIQQTINDVEVTRGKDKKDTELIKKLEKRIKDKVTVKKVKATTWDYVPDYAGQQRKIIADYIIYEDSEGVVIEMETEFARFAEGCIGNDDEKMPEAIKDLGIQQIWTYYLKDDKKRETLRDTLIDYFNYLAEQYELYTEKIMEEEEEGRSSYTRYCKDTY